MRGPPNEKGGPWSGPPSASLWQGMRSLEYPSQGISASRWEAILYDRYARVMRWIAEHSQAASVPMLQLLAADLWEEFFAVYVKTETLQ